MDRSRVVMFVHPHIRTSELQNIRTSDTDSEFSPFVLKCLELFVFMYFSSGYNLVEDYQFEANLTSTCNMYCDCSNNDLEPICGINGLTYFSPCHAGCTQFNTNEVAPAHRIMVRNYFL